ncbi:MAG: hypothetical protein JKY96_06315 [Phycisphaerales bacterium]|nr:hypothetical protein [Phycisphaerales bacterium]
MKIHPHKPALVLPILALLAVLCATSGCSNFRVGGSGGSGTMSSESSSTLFKASLPTRAYTSKDANTADIYLTDLSDEDLTIFFQSETNWTSLSGSMVHIHLFLNPKPGKTPIESTAANATIRYIILVDGQIGVYDGAGFILPSKKIGKKTLAGTLRNAPAQLTRKTTGFSDLLGITRIDLSFSAKRNAPKADALADRLNALSSAAEPID